MGPPGQVILCNNTESVPGPPGPPGTPGLSIVGPKGEPGGIVSRETFLTDRFRPGMLTLYFIYYYK